MLFRSGDQDQHNDDDASQGNDQGQVEGQDEDQNDNIDREVPPRCNAEIDARRKARNERTLIRIGHTLDKVIGDVIAKMSTRRQVANFCELQVHISIVEPQKFFEALEDPDWLDAMHEELNNLERCKVWKLVERPKECRNVIGTK